MARLSRLGLYSVLTEGRASFCLLRFLFWKSEGFSLRNLRVLCVSAVSSYSRKAFTAETLRPPRKRGENSGGNSQA